MGINKKINVNDGSGRKYEEQIVGEMVLDVKPQVGSFNGVTSDAVARAVAGASGEVPEVTENDNGKVLKAIYDEGGPAVEWGQAGDLPSYTASDEGKVLSVAVDEGAASLQWSEPPSSAVTTDGVVSGDGSQESPIALRFGETLTTSDAVEDLLERGMTWVDGKYTGSLSAADAAALNGHLTNAMMGLTSLKLKWGYFAEAPRVQVNNPAQLMGACYLCIAQNGVVQLHVQVGSFLPDGTGTAPGPVTFTSDIFSLQSRVGGAGYEFTAGEFDIYFSLSADGTTLDFTVTDTEGDNFITIGESVEQLDVAIPVPEATESDEGKVLGVVVDPETEAVSTGWISVGGGSDQPLPAVATNTLRFEFEDMSFDPSSDRGCNFTGTSWAKVTEATTRNIWDCTLASNSGSNAHFAITEPCKVIDGLIGKYRTIQYLFSGSTGLHSVSMGFNRPGDSSKLEQTFYGCSALEEISLYGNEDYAGNDLEGGDAMCSGCGRLKSFTYTPRETVDPSLLFIGRPYVFAQCYALEKIVGARIGIASSSYGGSGADIASAFQNCRSLKSLAGVMGTTCFVKNAPNAFQGCTSLESVGCQFKFMGTIPSTASMFEGCQSLTSVGIMDLSSLQVNMQRMFFGCSALPSVTLVRTGGVTNMSYAFAIWSQSSSFSSPSGGFRKLPELDTSSVTNAAYAFQGHHYADGALAMYQQLSQQANPPTTTTGCFTNCGSITHAADLAQIPAAWGGTGA